MAEATHTLRKHLLALWRAGKWSSYIGAAWTVFGALILFRDELLSPKQQSEFKVLNVLHDFSWQLWTMAALVIVVGGLFEASLRLHREILSRHHCAEADLGSLRGAESEEFGHESETTLALRQLVEKKTRQQFGLEARGDALRVTFGDTPAFEQTEVRADYIIRTMLVCVENIDTSHFITNCKIHGEFSGGNHLLVDSFTLNATEKRFVPIATHHEMPADKFIHIIAPRVGGFFAEAYDYLKLPLGGALITIHATSAETRPAKLICRVFVDDTGKLKMIKA